MQPSPVSRPDPTPPPVRDRVVVAMSGGVDSSVVAAMMHADGWDVVGVSMRLYGDASKAGRSCCSPDDLHDARGVAAEAGFPFYVANYQDAFRERVIDYFVDEYRRGRTPSPCILCNDHLKFEVLLERMVALEGRYLVTGHYARIEERDGRLALLRGADGAKDQSYFLFGLSHAALTRVRFPLGGMTKSEVRDLGRRLGVPTADKPESQDVCFVAGADYATFVEARLAAEDRRPGRIVHATTGEVLGTHEGIHRFTVGQRRGLGIAHAAPLYVKRIDAEHGDVMVDTRDHVEEAAFVLSRCNWLRWAEPPASFVCDVQVRYRQQAVPCSVEVDGAGGGARVRLRQPHAGISPGQAAVFYDGDEVLGGGWIEEVG